MPHLCVDFEIAVVWVEVDDTEKMKLKKKESMAKIRLVVDRVDSG
jgi:hypothetical protein